MTPNGPQPGQPEPRSGQESEVPYGEPADPWHGQQEAWDDDGAGPSTPAGSYEFNYDPAQDTTQSNGPTASEQWGPTGPARRRGPGAPIVALIVVLGLLVVVGVGTTAYLLNEAATNPPGSATPASSSAQPTDAGATAPAPAGTGDARFVVVVGDCIRNDGTEQAPVMRVTPCGKGTFEVLKRIDGKTSGEADAETKCSKVPGYSLWFFYDSELDGLDFVLCLKAR